jgi:hypothetical protein
MTALLRIILFLVFFYYLIRIITRILLPSLFGNSGYRKMNDSMGQSGSQRKTYDRKKEGEVKVDYAPQEGKKQKKRGEYIEYEEIKD